MKGPVSCIVVDVPAMNFPRKLGDTTKHITTRSDGRFDLQKDAATVLFFLIVHKNGGSCDGDRFFVPAKGVGRFPFYLGFGVFKSPNSWGYVS